MEEELFKPSLEISEANQKEEDLDLEMKELDGRDLPTVDMDGLMGYCCSCSCCC